MSSSSCHLLNIDAACCSASHEKVVFCREASGRSCRSSWSTGRRGYTDTRACKPRMHFVCTCAQTHTSDHVYIHTYLPTYIHTCTQPMYVYYAHCLYMNMNMYICRYVYIYICMQLDACNHGMDVWMSVCLSVCLTDCLAACMYVCMYVCTYVFL